MVARNDEKESNPVFAIEVAIGSLSIGEILPGADRGRNRTGRLQILGARFGKAVPEHGLEVPWPGAAAS